MAVFHAPAIRGPEPARIPACRSYRRDVRTDDEPMRLSDDIDDPLNV